MKELISGFLFLVVLLVFTGCETKKEEPKKDNQTGTQTDTSQKSDVPYDTLDTMKVVPDNIQTESTDSVQKKANRENQAAGANALKGTWRGTFDNRDATLKITSVKNDEFSGTINIKYREEVNQSVSGKFHPNTSTITMRDTEHSRYAGTYSAKMSGNKLNGTFTQNVEKKNFNFSFTKK